MSIILNLDTAVERAGGAVKLVSNTNTVNWSTIDGDLGAGRPVIVWMGARHYVVIVGKKGNQYFVNVPAVID